MRQIFIVLIGLAMVAGASGIKDEGIRNGDCPPSCTGRCVGKHQDATNELDVTQLYIDCTNITYFATNALFTLSDIALNDYVTFTGANDEWMRISPDPTYSNIVLFAENVPSDVTIVVEYEGATNVYKIVDGKIVLALPSNKEDA